MRKDLAKLFGFEREFNENTLDIFIDDKSKTIRISGESANKKCDIKFQDLQSNGLAQYCCTYKEYIVEFVFCSFNYFAIDNFIINSSICISFRGFKFVQCEFKDKTHFVYQTGTLIFQDCVFSNFALFENDQISLKIENNNEKYNSFDINSTNKSFKVKTKNSKDDYPTFSQINFKENPNEYNINFERINIDSIDFSNLNNSLHNKELSMKYCTLGSGLDFKDEIFSDIEFNTCTFKESVYFTYCNFREKTTFCACVFEKLASFYNSTFEKVPNFSASYFKEQKAVNLINVYIEEINFKSIEEYVEEYYEKDENYKKEFKKIEGEKNECKSKQEEKLKIEYQLKYIKNIRDSFKTIKDVLISQNNTLDAQEWHKLELYAKEKEFEINLKFKENQASANIFDNILIWFNCILFNAYRNTSDHHTNFLKIFHFTLGMICVYGIFIFIVNNFPKIDVFFKLIISDFLGFQITHYSIVILLIALSFIAFAYKNKKYILTKSVTFLMICLCLYFIYDNSDFFKILHFEEIFLCLLLYILSVFAFYIIFVFVQVSFLNFIFKLILYIIFLFILCSNPQLLNPLLGVFSSDKLYESKFEKSLSELNSSSVSKILDIMQENFENKNSDLNMTFTELNSAKDYIKANKNIIIDVNLTKAKNIMPNYENIAKSAMQDELVQGVIKSTSILYAIILLLCIFSLQKTARKNSIVPN